MSSLFFAAIPIAGIAWFLVWIFRSKAEPTETVETLVEKVNRQKRPELTEEELEQRKRMFDHYNQLNRRNQELVTSLSMRVLTNEEMAEVLQKGTHILLYWNYNGYGGANSGCYRSGELEEWFSQLLQAQGRLRLYADSLKPKKPTKKRVPKSKDSR